MGQSTSSQPQAYTLFVYQRDWEASTGDATTYRLRPAATRRQNDQWVIYDGMSALIHGYGSRSLQAVHQMLSYITSSAHLVQDLRTVCIHSDSFVWWVFSLEEQSDGLGEERYHGHCKKIIGPLCVLTTWCPKDITSDVTCPPSPLQRDIVLPVHQEPVSLVEAGTTLMPTIHKALWDKRALEDAYRRRNGRESPSLSQAFFCDYSYRLAQMGGRSQAIQLGRLTVRSPKGDIRTYDSVTRKEFGSKTAHHLIRPAAPASSSSTVASTTSVLRPLANPKAVLEEIQRELQHPHLIRILHVEDNGYGCFLYTPWYAGGSMSQYSRFTMEQREEILRGAWEGLRFLNVDRERLHYDIKPSNIFVDLTADGGVVGVLGDVNDLMKIEEECRKVFVGPHYTVTTRCYGAPFRHCDIRRDMVAMLLAGAEILSGVHWFKICSDYTCKKDDFGFQSNEEGAVVGTDSWNGGRGAYWEYAHEMKKATSTSQWLSVYIVYIEKLYDITTEDDFATKWGDYRDVYRIIQDARVNPIVMAARGAQSHTAVEEPRPTKRQRVCAEPDTPSDFDEFFPSTDKCNQQKQEKPSHSTQMSTMSQEKKEPNHDSPSWPSFA